MRYAYTDDALSLSAGAIVSFVSFLSFHILSLLHSHAHTHTENTRHQTRRQEDLQGNTGDGRCAHDRQERARGERE